MDSSQLSFGIFALVGVIMLVLDTPMIWLYPLSYVLAVFLIIRHFFL